MLTVGVYDVKQEHSSYRPPIPGSERNGHRRFYTLEQSRHGAHLSGIARRDQAMPQVVTDSDSPLPSSLSQGHISPGGPLPAQVHRVVAGRLWREAGEPPWPPSVVVNSARGTPRRWARTLALGEVYRSRCRVGGKLLKWLTKRQGAYIKGIVKNRGPDHAAEIVAATERYVLSLSHLDVSAAVRRLNQDSGYRVRRGTANRGSTSWRHRVPFRRFAGAAVLRHGASILGKKSVRRKSE